MGRVFLVMLVGLALAAGYLAAIWFGLLGKSQRPGVVADEPRPAAIVARHARAQREVARAVGRELEARQILFGDLHVHTTYSIDAFLHSLPLMQGEGAHPPADACDFARFCSALDFFSLNDHAESLTPGLWRDTKAAVRQCNAVAGSGSDPDLVAFTGWEWTQMGTTPETHYGHKNVIFRETDEARLPTRPISAAGVSFDAMRTGGARRGVLAMSLVDFGNRRHYFDFGAQRRALAAMPVCAAGVSVRELPHDCAEAAATPRELFAKLADWGFESLVIPHGNAWGNTTPPGVTWDKQLAEGNHDPSRQTLIEVYSGHGNSEEYRPWRHVASGSRGEPSCPAPSHGFVPGCWRAGEIIRERCQAEGLAAEACARRGEEARGHYVAAGRAARFTVPGQTPEDWLEAGQCVDCFQPAFDYRPGGSTQYALAARAGPGGFRFGFIASSDTHYARPATGYKEFTPDGMTDAWGVGAARARERFGPERGEPEARSRPMDPAKLLLLPGGDVERSASFYYTGGLVAVHASGRSRDAIWQALLRREVYGTSGPRILLWFELRNAPGAETGVPMGGAARMAEAPRFRVRAAGALRQRPGCPAYAERALGPERRALLCKNECYHPGDERHPIARIEVVRIRPRIDPNEDVAGLIADPWRVHACPADKPGCVFEFEDPEHGAAGRDTIYYVRAIQEATPHVNGDGLRCQRGAQGECVRVRPCRAGTGDDCLGGDEARAWSSPIFVDYAGADSG